MIENEDTIIIHIDALLKDYDKSNSTNFIPTPKENLREFLEKMHSLYNNVHILSDMNPMITQKILRDNKAETYVNQIDLIKLNSNIFIGKNSISFNDTTNDSVKFTSMLDYTIDFLNKN